MQVHSRNGAIEKLRVACLKEAVPFKTVCLAWPSDQELSTA